MSSNSASITLVTSIHATIRRRVRVVLRLSPLLRHVLATAQPRPDGGPLLLPDSIPRRCAHNLFQCPAKIRWRVGDGRNRVFFCDQHYEQMIQAHDAFEFDSERWVG
jgi:hypothetical protein